jgi:predicted metal-dependent HD superfamily phosphohydrolase
MANIDIKKLEEFIEDLFREKIPEHLTYHDLVHTRYVAEQAKLIAQETGLTKDEMDIVLAATWFHDSGFTVSTSNHEKEGQKIASDYLSSEGVDAETIEQVIKCIAATKMPQNPGENRLAQVLCDADMSYLSEDFYMDRTALLRKEWNNISDDKMSKKSYWDETTLLFQNHTYYTEYGKNNFGSGKEKNFQKIQKILRELPAKQKKKLKKLEKENTKLGNKLNQEKLPGRGVESMFRLTARNQINLSSIADNKANILISINSIVLTVVVSMGIGKISDYPVITLPSIVFVGTCLITIIFAILSTRPKISSGKFTKDDIHNKKVNLLFFGNFYNMKAEEYDWAIKEMMKDSNYLYSSMIRDQYSLGRVIGKKYRLLRVAYTVFMIGIIVSTILFGVFILAIPG